MLRQTGILKMIPTDSWCEVFGRDTGWFDAMCDPISSHLFEGTRLDCVFPSLPPRFLTPQTKRMPLWRSGMTVYITVCVIFTV